MCSNCGLPFVSPRAMDAADPRCAECLAETPDFAGARSFGLYTGKLRQAVLRVKFSSDERLGGYLGGLLISTWDCLPNFTAADAPLIIPVPLHKSRRRERGFNQSELLAEALIRALGKRESKNKPRMLKSCLVRCRATIPQTGLSVSARRENLRGAFEVKRAEQIRGREIVLVDDVMTPGATLSACARTLNRAGATGVWALTLARATPQFPDLTIHENDNPVDGFGPKST
jgi:ComF family protein